MLGAFAHKRGMAVCRARPARRPPSIQRLLQKFCADPARSARPMRPPGMGCCKRRHKRAAAIPWDTPRYPSVLR